MYLLNVKLPVLIFAVVEMKKDKAFGDDIVIRAFTAEFQSNVEVYYKREMIITKFGVFKRDELSKFPTVYVAFDSVGKHYDLLLKQEKSTATISEDFAIPSQSDSNRRHSPIPARHDDCHNRPAGSLSPIFL